MFFQQYLQINLVEKKCWQVQVLTRIKNRNCLILLRGWGGGGECSANVFYCKRLYTMEFKMVILAFWADDKWSLLPSLVQFDPFKLHMKLSSLFLFTCHLLRSLYCLWTVIYEPQLSFQDLNQMSACEASFWCCRVMTMTNIPIYHLNVCD